MNPLDCNVSRLGSRFDLDALTPETGRLLDGQWWQDVTGRAAQSWTVQVVTEAPSQRPTYQSLTERARAPLVLEVTVGGLAGGGRISVPVPAWGGSLSFVGQQPTAVLRSVGGTALDAQSAASRWSGSVSLAPGRLSVQCVAGDTQGDSAAASELDAVIPAGATHWAMFANDTSVTATMRDALTNQVGNLLPIAVMNVQSQQEVGRVAWYPLVPHGAAFVRIGAITALDYAGVWFKVQL